MAVRYTPQDIASAAIYAANELCGEKLVTPMGTIWYHTKQMKENHLKSFWMLMLVMAMEISLASEPRSNFKLQEKYIQKLVLKGYYVSNTSVYYD